MTWLRPVALLLVLVLLVSASRAATLCVEADGTVQVELVAAPCCDEEGSPPPPPEPGASLAPLSPCAGCDDRPLDEARWTRASTSPAAPLPALAPCLAGAAPLPPPPPALEARDRPLACGPPTPRAARPAVSRP